MFNMREYMELFVSPEDRLDGAVECDPWDIMDGVRRRLWAAFGLEPQQVLDLVGHERFAEPCDELRDVFAIEKGVSREQLDALLLG